MENLILPVPSGHDLGGLVEAADSRATDAVLSFLANSIARVAQWIRALASGARGRRFDPSRGYHKHHNPKLVQSPMSKVYLR
jgi:hypothetical protein